MLNEHGEDAPSSGRGGRSILGRIPTVTAFQSRAGNFSCSAFLVKGTNVKHPWPEPISFYPAGIAGDAGPRRRSTSRRGPYLSSPVGDAGARFSVPPSRLELHARAALTPACLESLRPRVEPLADELVQEVMTDVHGGRVDLVAGFTKPLALLAVTELFGIPPYSRRRFWAWTARSVGGPSLQRGHALIALNQCLAALLAIKREAPGPDLLTGLAARPDGRPDICDAQLADLARQLIVATLTTTISMLGNTLVALLHGPGDVHGAFMTSGAGGRQFSDQPQPVDLVPDLARSFALTVTTTGLDTLQRQAPDLRAATAAEHLSWVPVGSLLGPEQLLVNRPGPAPAGRP